jgi:hypothetical protein
LGGYLNNKNEWTPLTAAKVFPNEAMSCRFKTILLKSLRNHFQEKIPSEFWNKKWIVYTKKAETGDSHVIEYLGAYVKRIAIASSRIVSVDDSNVTFKYRHCIERNKVIMKTMTVSGFEFLRRYMQHVLPGGFVRVRYYGLMHPAYFEDIIKIKNSEGNITLSERHGSKDSNVPGLECSTCKKPLLMTMIIFPFYFVYRVNNQDKYPSKFYNTNEELKENQLKTKRTTCRSI